MIFGRNSVNPHDIGIRNPRPDLARIANDARTHRNASRKVINKFHNTHAPERNIHQRNARPLNNLEFSHQQVAHDKNIEASTGEALAFGVVAIGGLSLAYLLLR